MIKILVAIPHYGNKNREFLLKSLFELDSYKKYSFDINLYLTNNIELPVFKNLRINIYLYPSIIKSNLVLAHRFHFVQQLEKYDYFFYIEDDILINESVIDTYFEIQKELPFPYVCGFVRYEQKSNDDYKYLIDCHPAHSIHRNGKKVVKSKILIKNIYYFDFYNLHQACYLLSRQLLNYALSSDNYIVNKKPYVGKLEDAASNVFYNCGIKRVLPVNLINKLLIHHMPNKYTEILSNVYNKKHTPSPETIINEKPPFRLFDIFLYNSK